MDDVIIGRDGSMFLATSVHNILDHLTGKREIAPVSIENFGRNIVNRAAWCRERGVTYRHVIYPDKTSVMKSYFPISGTRSFSERYQHLFDENVIDLTEHLPDSDTHFLRTDTHLNFTGKVETTLAVMQQFQDVDEATARQWLMDCRGDPYEYLGDLGSKVSPKQTETHFRVVNRKVKTFNNQVGANDGLTIVTFNLERLKRRENKRLLVFGDSFVERSLKLFSCFYSEILFCRTRYFHDEIALMFKPDHIITESAERYFSCVRLDEQATRFNLLYGLRGFNYSKDENFYKAYNAVLSFGREAHGVFVSRLLADA